jgi:HK97 family phage prohead protease
VRDAARPNDEFEVTMTTEDRDRMNDRVMAAGLDMAGWLKNPVVMFSHDYGQLPVAVGTGVKRVGNGWRLRGRWITDDPFADRVKNVWQQGGLGAASLGFRPVQSVRNEFGGHDFLKNELLEVSLTAIPANPHALKSMSGNARAALEALERAVMRHPLVIAKGATHRFGPPIPTSGTVSNEVRVLATDGESPAAAVQRSWSHILAPHRGPAQPIDRREPEVTVTRNEIAERVQQDIRDQLAIRRLALAHEAYSAQREEEQRARQSSGRVC